ncbi:MAG TPA: glutamate mutase L [Nocardioidaceae bacterium]|nr:glutamate mutase L [Nocardioidaceae bacterium]
MSRLVAAVDFGSTFTKAMLVDVDGGDLVAKAEHPTTIETDVLDGWAACRAALAERDRGAVTASVVACSSAGGGLRIAVVGHEELVTAEAGRRVSLSSGGTVVHVGAGGLADGVNELRASRPDVVLLVGGTDGGNAAVLLGAAKRLADAEWPGPVVVAGNSDVAGEVAELLALAGVDVVVADNVVPRIGVLRPDSARAAIRETFLRHVIGGKRLSASAEFLDMVRGPTPDVVLSGVELLAEQVGDVAVVDVGGATTDVHSVIAPDPEDSGLAREVVASAPLTRTVEGDLGMRWSAPTTVARAAESGLVDDAERWADAADRRSRDPGWLPRDPSDVDVDDLLASSAAVLALRRHAGRQRVVFGPDGRLVEREGVDLREVGLLIGSGGVFRHAPGARVAAILGGSVGDHVEGGWLLPREPRVVVDREYVLAAAGLLRAEHPEVAAALVHLHLAT